MALDISYTSRNIGDIFYTLRKDSTLNGAVPCTGTEYNLSDFSTNSAAQDLADLISGSMLPVMSYANYAAQVKSYGSCAYFAYDENTGKFKVPTIKNVYVQAGDNATLAKYLAPGLPNITGAGGFGEARSAGGSYDSFLNQASGAFYWLKDKGYYGSKGGIDTDNALLAFDASRSNSIYGRVTDTVQPPTIILRPMVQLMSAGSAATEDTDEDESTVVKPLIEYSVPYIFVPGTEAKATEVNANFDYIVRALKDLSGSSDVVHLTGTETITGQKTFTVAPKTKGLELTGGPIDFHYGNSTVDYTARLFEAVQGYLAINQNPPANDSSTKIATTNWVNSKVANSNISGNIASWIKLPNGTIIQYGTRTGLGFWGGWSWSNFPTTFPNACRAVAVSWTYVQGAGNKGSTCGVQYNKSQIGVYPRFEQSTADLSYIAIGN